MEQAALFDLPEPLPAGLPEGLRYEDAFLGAEAEAALIALIRGLPLAAAKYKGFTARRRVLSYGGSFDYDANRLQPAAPLIAELEPLRERVARWAGFAPENLVHALIAEYAPGTTLGWHRDVPEFEEVMGVSLGAPAVLRFRPWPPDDPKRADIVRLKAQPCSIYLLRGPARWAWQHSVAPVEAWRWSVTFRTRRQHGPRRQP